MVEKRTPGLSFGKKEEKMGIIGSVTREVFLEEVIVSSFISKKDILLDGRALK
jgi:alkylation response protein AidB-like acyl-CoA dehydrogenase